MVVPVHQEDAAIGLRTVCCWEPEVPSQVVCQCFRDPLCVSRSGRMGDHMYLRRHLPRRRSDLISMVDSDCLPLGKFAG